MPKIKKSGLPPEFAVAVPIASATMGDGHEEIHMAGVATSDFAMEQLANQLRNELGADVEIEARGAKSEKSGKSVSMSDLSSYETIFKHADFVGDRKKAGSN